MEFEPTFLKLVFLLFIGLIAGFVDSIAGGGGLITLPSLLAVGIPPHLALGTNKLQSSFGSSTAALRYAGSGLVKREKLPIAVAATLAGAVTGTWLIQRISADFLRKGIPFLLLGIFLYTLFSPDLGKKEAREKLPRWLFYTIAGLVIGFYDGFIGPGTGSFWTISLVTLAGLDLKSATANTKITNFTSNIVSLIVFLIGGKVVFAAGALMAMGQVAGAWTGSHLVIRKGTGFIRIFFLCVVALTILNLFRQEYF